MKHAIFSLLCLSTLFTGCNKNTVTDSSMDYERIRWMLGMKSLLNQYTERTYQCISEIHSLTYNPAGFGPICRESCRLLEQVNVMADTAPAYIDTPQQFRVGESKLCSALKKGI